MIRVAAWLAAGLTGLWALIRLGGLERGPVVHAMALTPYATLGSVTVFGACVLLRRWWPAMLAGLATVGLVVAVLPRAVADAQPDRRPDLGAATLRVLTANLHFGDATRPR